MAELKIVGKHWRFLDSARQCRFVVMYGGASSAKSWSLGAWLLQKVYSEPGVGVLVLRKTKPAVRKSCYRLLKHWVDDWRWPARDNKSDLTLTAPNGSFIQCDGFDDPEKVKSIEGINYVWMEETTEFNRVDLMQLNLRARASNSPGRINQIFLTFNPVDPVGNVWLEELTRQAPRGKCLGSDLAVMHATHTDNPFLSPEEHAAIEGLADADEEYSKIYRLGLWATPTAIIYANWDIVDEFPSAGTLDEVGYGLDFGYVHPTALLKVGRRGNDVYVDETLYETHLHNAQLIERLPELVRDRNAVIMADSAEPAYIDEIAGAGWNVHATVKAEGQCGKSFVGTGIDRVRRVRLHITRSSSNVLEEIRGYKWRQDRSGNTLPEPVKFKDHAMDALRYYLGSQQDDVETEVIQVPDWLRSAMEDLGG